MFIVAENHLSVKLTNRLGELPTVLYTGFMIRRFSLYGFLKNQRYFEPFLLLVFMEKGLTFFEIGVLIAIREATVVVLEIPSGAIADVHGRRMSMVVSFVAYIVSFVAFAELSRPIMLSGAMVLFGIGEAFRTGTHKAMIFSWLRHNNREHDRTILYGYTRSWSKYGSALSTVLAALFVFFSDSYDHVFYWAIIPYMINIANFLGYPSEVEDNAHRSGDVIGRLRSTIHSSVRSSEIRRLYVEAMGFDGVFHAVKDYVQPVVVALCLTAGSRFLSGGNLSEVQLTSLAIAPVYVLLHLLSAVASRRAHRFVQAQGGSDAAAQTLWWMTCANFGVMTLGAYFGVTPVVIATFVVLNVAQNLWRPILITRFDAYGGPFQGATLLSIESQARRLATMLIAPVVGWAVDLASTTTTQETFWPVGVVGGVVGLAFVLRRTNRVRR